MELGTAFDQHQTAVNADPAAVKEARRRRDLFKQALAPEDDPRHVVEYADREVRQQFSVCFACRLLGGQLATSDKSSEVGFFTPAEIQALPVHESIRLRIRHYLERRPEPVIA